MAIEDSHFWKSEDGAIWVWSKPKISTYLTCVKSSRLYHLGQVVYGSTLTNRKLEPVEVEVKVKLDPSVSSSWLIRGT